VAQGYQKGSAMKTNLLLLIIFISVAALYTWHTDNAVREAAPATMVVKKDYPEAPDFTFIDLTGASHKLSDFRSRGIVLNFWATWCAPCVIEFPAMLQLAKLQPETVFLFLSLDFDDKAIERFLKNHGKNIPPENVFIARDTESKISAGLYKTYQLPETYLINSEGFISEKIIGADVDWTSSHMQQKLKNLSR
jgi:cytochrome c biogenesis protein CcmG, thiol:disulfide interchange protein DsbE